MVSARHLTCLRDKRNPKKVVEFDGIPLRGLSERRVAGRVGRFCWRYDLSPTSTVICVGGPRVH